MSAPEPFKIPTPTPAPDWGSPPKKATIKDIETADKTLADMVKERKAGNDAYKNGKSDDEKAIVLLEKAKAALAEYYGKKSFLQQDKTVLP